MDRAHRRNLGCGLILALVLACSDGPLSAVEFFSSLEAARGLGDNPRPVVVTFSATWCGWCRKMATTTFPDPQVTAIADQYLWVKLDADEATALAARWRVQGLPHTLLLDAQDRVLGSQSGYLTPAALVSFLAESQANPQPHDGLPQTLLDELANIAASPDAAAAVRQAVELLAQQSAAGRDVLMERLAAAGPDAWPHLAALLNDERLAVRAAAGGVLQRVTSAKLPFDPFAADDVRSLQAAAWVQWTSMPVRGTL